MRMIRVSEDDFNKMCAEVIHEIIHEKGTPTDLKLLESMIALQVTTKLKVKLFDD